MMIQDTTTVNELGEGDFLVDLDNGYVVSNDMAANEVQWSGLAGALDDCLRLITFHDRFGNENYLIMAETHPIRVGREV